eukprot:jgi/Chlat1/7220/Chrsp57S06766
MRRKYAKRASQTTDTSPSQMFLKRITDGILANERSTPPELPDERRQGYLALRLPLAEALLLVDEATNALFFDNACRKPSPRLLPTVDDGRHWMRLTSTSVLQIMQKSGGRADQELIQKLLMQKLDKEMATAFK